MARDIQLVALPFDAHFLSKRRGSGVLNCHRNTFLVPAGDQNCGSVGYDNLWVVESWKGLFELRRLCETCRTVEQEDDDVNDATTGEPAGTIEQHSSAPVITQ